MEPNQCYPCSGRITVGDIFGPLRINDFIENYFHRLPVALAGSALGLCDWGGWKVFDNVCDQPTTDILIIRRGEQLPGPHSYSTCALRSLLHDGYTVRIRHAERHHAKVRELAELFTATFESPVDIHLYATPADSFGFSWHYDAEDVFIVQTHGKKEYLLRKNTVNPWPLEETMPVDLLYERELMPLMRVVLHAGDLLYIPCGYWHRAQVPADSEVAISMAIGVMSRSAMHILDVLRARLMDSLVWRQRLPITNHLAAENAEAAYRRILNDLAVDFARELSDPALVKQLMAHCNRDKPVAVAESIDG